MVSAGCSPDNRHHDLAACVAQTGKEAPPGPGETAEEIHDDKGEIVRDCMKAAGYRQDTAGEKCLDDIDFNAECYVKAR